MSATNKYLPNGTVLCGGKYKIIQKRAAGGFGCAYVVECVPTGEIFAIKELFVSKVFHRNPDGSVFTDPSMQEWHKKVKAKFVEEANILMKLDHPNIVKVKELFEENNTLYYVMDYIEGASLFTLISRVGAVSDKVAVKYILQVADALKYLHTNNRLHLDVKPSNIMIDKVGNATLIDFGICAEFDDDFSAIDREATIMGNCASYSPIEMFSSKYLNLRPSTDIYSLGATLYYMIAGKRPPGSMRLVVHEKLSWDGIDVDTKVRNTIIHSMNPKRNMRPQSVDEFARMLTGDTTDNREADSVDTQNVSGIVVDDVSNKGAKLWKIIIGVLVAVIAISVALCFFVVL